MLRIFVGLFTILLLNGEAAFSRVLKAASLPRRHVLEIREFDFYPQHALVSPGDTIVWINRDIVPHTARAKDGTWGSPSLEEGGSWEMVVQKSGMQAYFCEFHPHMGGVLEARKESSRDFLRIQAQ